MDPALRSYSVVGRALMVLRVEGYMSFETVDDARLRRLLCLQPVLSDEEDLRIG